MKWRQIVNHPNYSISNTGLVRRVSGGRGARPGRVLKPYLSGCRQKYPCVMLDCKEQMIHILLLEAFVCRRPNGAVALHLNDNALDFRLSNLRWGTKEDNVRQYISNGLSIKQGKSLVIWHRKNKERFRAMMRKGWETRRRKNGYKKSVAA